MIYNQWYIILESKELGKNRPLRVKRLNEDLALWRDENGGVCIISDKCCHRGAALSCGKIVNGRIECPFHGFLYDKTGKITMIPANGKNQPVPANMKVHSYKSFEKQGFIWIFWGDDDKITGEPFYFDELGNFTYSSFKDNWNVHYSRAIENQLDVVHLPFVHWTTIGKGNKTLVNGPVVVRDDDLITFYVNNIVDDGKTTPKKPDEITGYEEFFHLQFHFPNVWQNFIADKIRATASLLLEINPSSNTAGIGRN
jgi:phenylpropionate dioxygenase-like ring-hydroxylating dioxygenase large terminal subunit